MDALVASDADAVLRSSAILLRQLGSPKLCFPFSWLSYALHVLKHARDGDILVLDNYELIYVLAARLVSLFRRVMIILDYEDGKHLIDEGWVKLLSGAAEKLGRGLLDGALLAHPALGARLPAELPKVVVPGFVLLRTRQRKLPLRQTSAFYTPDRSMNRAGWIFCSRRWHNYLRTAGGSISQAMGR